MTSDLPPHLEALVFDLGLFKASGEQAARHNMKFDHLGHLVPWYPSKENPHEEPPF
jgi:hypothetical protein